MQRLEELYNLNLQKKEVEEKIKKITKVILDGIESSCENVELENEKIKVSYVAESELKSLDLKKIKNKEPQLYEELLDVYPKITKRSAYLRVKIK